MRNIIKQVLKEEVDLRSERVKFIVNKYGIGQAIELVVGGVDTIRNVYQSNPSEFLNQFNDLTPVEKDGKIYYIDKDGNPLFYYFYPYKYNVYIDYTKIWAFFEDILGLKDIEIKEILKNWLEDVYNLKGLIPTDQFWIDSTSGWKNTIN